ncbi:MULTISPECIES: hypothetical protein [unclassified Flavobacterium]|uniref:hypothetical protein n=1 Tax=unclassified Flavobacterium TaxID=196869 RepID=UPI00360D92EE
MAVKTEIQIPITTATPFEAKAKMLAIKTIASLDTDAVEKLAELAQNPKAVNKLKNSFGMIKAFIG